MNIAPGLGSRLRQVAHEAVHLTRCRADTLEIVAPGLVEFFCILIQYHARETRQRAQR